VSARVARERFPVHESVRVAIAAADALGHAHAHGVVHRDVTGRNIMLSDDDRVVVLDFGLALHGGNSRFTGEGALIGTPGYVAPEVAAGKEGDHRADLFGLGVVLYEMLTGRLPFEGAVAAALLYQVVYCDPPPPSARRSGIPAALDSIVLKALARDLATRYRSAEEMAAALRSVSQNGHPARRRRAARPRHGKDPTPVAGARPALPQAKLLAVLPFTDSSPDLQASVPRDLFARGLSESIGNSLSRFAGVQIIPATSHPERAGGELDPRQIARSLGANLVLRGTIQRSGRRIRVTYSLIHPDSAAQIAGDTVDGPTRNLFDVEDRLLASVVDRLGLEDRASVSVVRDRRRDPAAREHYLQALGYLQRHENEASVRGAISLLEMLRRSEPDDAAVTATLGRACLAMYRLTHQREWEERAATACERALELDPESPEVQVTLGQLHHATGRYAQAIRTFRLALELRHDYPDALLGLSSAYEAAGKLDDAEQAARDAIAQRPRDWRGHSRLGVICFNRGNYGRAIEPWRDVIRLTPDNPRGHANLGSAYFHLGRYEEALERFRASLEAQPNKAAYSGLGTVLFYLGSYEEAASALEKSAALGPFDPGPWGNLGDAYRWIPGREAKAALAYDQAIGLVREELEINPNLGWAWARLARWLAMRGSTVEALRALRRSLKHSPSDVRCMAEAVTIHHLAGDRAAALEWLERAVGAGYDGDAFDRDPELATLRSDPAYRKIVKEVRKDHDTDGSSTATQPSGVTS
jgi:serine/threonine-protein kinase